MGAVRQPAFELGEAARPAGADVPRGPIDHPPEDFEPLETYEQDPGEAPGPDDGGPDRETSAFIRLAAGLYASGASQAMLDALGRRGPHDRATLDAALRRIATLGALACALHDRLAADLAAAPGEAA